MSCGTGRSRRVMEAMMQMIKLETAVLQQAYAGERG